MRLIGLFANLMGYTLNLAKMDGSGLGKMLKAILFNIELPTADQLNNPYQMNGNKETCNIKNYKISTYFIYAFGM